MGTGPSITKHLKIANAISFHVMEHHANILCDSLLNPRLSSLQFVHLFLGRLMMLLAECVQQEVWGEPSRTATKLHQLLPHVNVKKRPVLDIVLLLSMFVFLQFHLAFHLNLTLPYKA